MKVFRTALAAASLLAMGSSAFAAISPVFDFVPVTTSQTGGSVVITARISGLDDSATMGLDEVLAGFSLFIEYDSSKLSYTGSAPFLAGPQFTDPVTTLVDANFSDTLPGCGTYGGTMTATCFTLDTFLADADLFIAQGSSGGSFNLFSMSFTLLDTSTAWTTTIGVAGTNGFTPEFIGSENATAGQPTILAMSFGEARVTNVPAVTPPTQGIPEPGTYGLAAMALLAAGVVTRRRRGN